MLFRRWSPSRNPLCFHLVLSSPCGVHSARPPGRPASSRCPFPSPPQNADATAQLYSCARTYPHLARDSVASHSPSLLHGNFLVSSTHTQAFLWSAACSMAACGGAGPFFFYRFLLHRPPSTTPSPFPRTLSLSPSDPPPPRVNTVPFPPYFRALSLVLWIGSGANLF